MILNLNLINQNEKILCAVSGGADSQAMLYSFVKIKDKLNLEIFVCHLNHKTRDGDSDLDAKFVSDFCKKHSIPCLVEEIEIKNQGLGFEASARDVRYNFFKRAKEYFNAEKIATAHNLNDNLETMILNLARGTGLSGLCGIPEIRNDIIRPILNVSRENIEQFLANEKIDFVHDKTNDEDNFTRNKVRHHIIPELLNVNQNALNSALLTANFLNNDNFYLKKVAKSSFSEIVHCNKGELELNIVKFLNLDTAIQFRVIEEILSKFSKTLGYNSFNVIYKVINSKKPSSKCEIFSDLDIFRNYDTLVFAKKTNKTEILKFTLNEKMLTIYTNKFTNLDFYCHADYDKIDFNTLILSKKNDGDFFEFDFGKKSIKKAFIDKKIPQNLRDFVPILRDKNGMISVCFLGTTKKFKTNKTLTINFRSI